ncbi:hypothetical protein J7J18_04365 [bacterium]|nr:hypothetical protein [bacterium]
MGIHIKVINVIEHKIRELEELRFLKFLIERRMKEIGREIAEEKAKQAEQNREKVKEICRKLLQ